MKNNKGFTLVELLAVIAILAILVIIALPNVMGMFNSAKKSSFMTEVKQVYKVAQQTWISDSMFETKDHEYGRCDGCSYKELDLSGRKELKYYIKINKAGEIVQYVADDGTYKFYYNGPGLLIEKISESDIVPTDGASIVPNTSNGGETPNSQYYYSLLNNIRINNTIDLSTEAVTDYQSLGTDAFFRLLVNGNVITSYDLGFIYNGNVHFFKTGSGSSIYNENKQILNSTFGSSNCTETLVNNHYEYRCENNDYYRAGIFDDGFAYADKRGQFCQYYPEGSDYYSGCGIIN